MSPLSLTGVVLLASGLGIMGPDVPFTHLVRGPLSGLDEPAQVVVRSRADWQALWNRHAPNEETPRMDELDFGEQMIVGVFLGSRPTGGHTVSIEQVHREGTRLVVGYLERRPAAGSLVPQIVTSPFDVVVLPHHDETVDFVRLDEASQ